MKKLLPYLLVFAFLLQIANAETLLYSGKVITDTDKEISGSIFRFRYDETANKVFVQTPSVNLIVDNGACKSNNVFKVCISKANFSYKNITTYVYYYELDVSVYKLTGSLTATSKASPATLLQGESSEFTITITNPTDFEITSIKFSEDLSKFFVREAKGCTLDSGIISWEGKLQSKYDKVCSATLVALKDGTFSLSGNLSYFNSYETEKKATDTVTIKVLPEQLGIAKRIDNVTEARQPFHMNMSLQNINKDEKIEGFVRLELPANIHLLKEIQGFTGDFNALQRNFVLEPLSFLNYSLYLEASKDGKEPIRQTFDYTIKATRRVIENETFINASEPKPIINFTASHAELAPGQEFIAYAKLRNPSKVHELTDLKAALTSAYHSQITAGLNKLAPNESSFIISQTLILPKDFTGSQIRLGLSLDYKFFGTLKSANASIEVQVKQDMIAAHVAEQAGNISENMTKTDMAGTGQPAALKPGQSSEQNLSKSADSGQEIQEIAAVTEDLVFGLGQNTILIAGLIFMGILGMAFAAIIVKVALKIRKELQSEERIMQQQWQQSQKQKPKLKREKILIVLIMLLILLLASMAFLVKKMAAEEAVEIKPSIRAEPSTEAFVAAEPEKKMTLANQLIFYALIFAIILGVPVLIYRIHKIRKRIV